MIAMFVTCILQFFKYNFFGFNFVDELSHLSSYFLGFQISLGLSNNHSSSSVAMVFCLILLSKNVSKNHEGIGKYFILTLAVALLTYSTASTFIFLIFLLYYLFTKGRFKLWLLLFILSLLLLIANFYDYEILRNSEGAYIYRKYTIDYFLTVISGKLDLFLKFFSSININLFLFGTDGVNSQTFAYTSSDFSLIYTLKGMGFIRGLCLLFVPIILFGFRTKVLLLFLFYIFSWMHYPSLAGPFGSIVLAIYLITYKNCIKRYV